MRIVYVEDNLANVHLVKRVARMGQHEVINYIDGTDALNRFAQDNPDLVLMDIQLAGELTGLQVVKEIRVRGYKTPIIAVTAYAMVGDRERCIEAGCNGYMSKPIPVMELVEMFNQYDVPKTETKDTKEAETSDSEQAEETSVAVKTEVKAEESTETAKSEVKAEESTETAKSEKTPESETEKAKPESAVAPLDEGDKTLPMKPATNSSVSPTQEETPTLVHKPGSSDDAPVTEPSPTQKREDVTRTSFATRSIKPELSAEGADRLSDDDSDSVSLKSDGDNDDLSVQSEEKKRTAEIE